MVTIKKYILWLKMKTKLSQKIFIPHKSDAQIPNKTIGKCQFSVSLHK